MDAEANSESLIMSTRGPRSLDDVRILLLNAHPDEGSLSDAIVAAYVRFATVDDSSAVEVSRYRRNFNCPVSPEPTKRKRPSA